MQSLDEKLTIRIGGQIAAVQQQVAIGGQRIGPMLNLVEVLFDAPRIEPRVPDPGHAVVAVRQEPDSVVAGVAGQGCIDLSEAVACGIEKDKFKLVPRTCLFLQRSDQLLDLVNALIHQDQFMPWFGGGLSRCVGCGRERHLVDRLFGQRRIVRHTGN